MVALDPFAPSGWPLNKPPQSGHSSGCHLFPATTVQFLSTERPPLWLSPTVAGHSWGEKPSPPAPVCSLPQLAGLPSCLAIWSRDKAWSTLISKHDVVIMACLQILFYLHLFVWLLLVLSLTSVRTSSLLLSPFTSWLLPAPGCPVCLSAIAYKTTTICSTYCLEFQFLVMHTWLVLQQ